MSKESSKPERIKADCPECGPNRWANVVANFARRQDDDESGTWLHTDFRILQCPACEAVYFQRDSVFSEDEYYYNHPITGEVEGDYRHTIEQWPSRQISRRERPGWVEKLAFVDTDLMLLIESVYKALEGELDVLTAIGIRTVFDRASELLEIDPAKSFNEKLDDLLSSGKIGRDERDILDILTDAGSAAAHRGWRPTSEELDTMLSSIEGFLQRNFVLGDAVKKLKARVPLKQKRQRGEKPVKSGDQTGKDGSKSP